MITNTCLKCNKVFKRDRVRKFCSLKCKYAGQSKSYKIRCKCCATLINTTTYRNKQFCSKTCQYNIERTIYKCEHCGKMFDASGWKRNRRSKHHFCSKKCVDKWQIGRPNNKISKTLSNKIANGEIHPMSGNYRRGYMLNESTNEMEYYHSSYEKIRMEQLNESKVKWTKRHKITIPYKDSNNVSRNYIPDFLIDGKIIEEVKPKDLLFYNNNLQKSVAAQKYCKKNNLKYRILTEKELNI